MDQAQRREVRPQIGRGCGIACWGWSMAWQHGPAAAGRHYDSALGRFGGGGALAAWSIEGWPSYPRHRARRVSPAAVELMRQARQEFG